MSAIEVCKLCRTENLKEATMSGVVITDHSHRGEKAVFEKMPTRPFAFT